MDKIISNIEQGIKNGLRKSHPVVRELKERSHDLEITTEYFLDLLAKNVTDIPSATMIHLNTAQKELEAALKEFYDYMERTGQNE